VNGHSLKLHFCMFEKSQGKYNNLDCHKKIWNVFHYLKFTCSKFDKNKKMFLHVQSIQP
jgi:hypothetical protein